MVRIRPPSRVHGPSGPPGDCFQVVLSRTPSFGSFGPFDRPLVRPYTFLAEVGPMMLVSTKPLENQPAGTEAPFAFTAEIVEGVGRNLQADGQLTKLSRGLLVRVHAVWEAEAQCDRCLGEFTIPLEAQLEETVGNPEAPSDTDLAFDGTHLDLEPLIREAGVLAWPPKVLCREDCRGLCPVCGHDLNRGPCSCEGRALDPRLGVLEKLKLEDD